MSHCSSKCLYCCIADLFWAIDCIIAALALYIRIASVLLGVYYNTVRFSSAPENYLIGGLFP